MRISKPIPIVFSDFLYLPRSVGKLIFDTHLKMIFCKSLTYFDLLTVTIDPFGMLSEYSGTWNGVYLRVCEYGLVKNSIHGQKRNMSQTDTPTNDKT